MISEGDILYKEHDPTEGKVGGPLGWIVDGSPNYRGAAKAQAVTAGTAMTSPAVTIPPYESVAQAARMMCEHGVNRLPVVKGDRLVGIVTRADLVRAFTRTDAEIERELREDVLARTMWVEPGRVDLDRAKRRRHAHRPAPHADRRRAARPARGAGTRRAFGRVGRALGDRRHDAEGQARDRAAGPMTQLSHAFEIEQVRRRLEAGNGGYEVVHTSPGLEVGVYVLVAPEPDHQQPHADDELYVVLEGSGVLNVEGEAIPVAEGQSVFVPAGAVHQFTAYEGLSVLVIFARTRHGAGRGARHALSLCG